MINDLFDQPVKNDPKTIHQISLTGNLGGENNKVMFFIVEEAKEIILNFLQGTVKVLYFCFI